MGPALGRPQCHGLPPSTPSPKPVRPQPAPATAVDRAADQARGQVAGSTIHASIAFGPAACGGLTAGSQWARHFSPGRRGGARRRRTAWHRYRRSRAANVLAAGPWDSDRRLGQATRIGHSDRRLGKVTATGPARRETGRCRYPAHLDHGYIVAESCI